MLPATPKEKEPLFLVEDQSCRRFSLDEIRSATQNFDEAMVIGRGGFGKVYKGHLKDGSNTVVAIKQSNSMSSQGAPEFQAEVEMLSKIRHCNLVSLIGYSYEGNEMALVYEYMPQGTLEDHLHKDGSRLSWLQLLKICKGAARGLDYLHTGTGTQHGIIHRDVKSSNVLLDENFAAKISDFGLAKIGPTNQTCTHVSTRVKGTFGYMDPRYVYTGNLTIKSDVYSFGVLLLEVLCGRPAVDTRLDEEQMGLAPWAQDCIKKGKLNNIIDSRLRGQISSNCMKDFARIASRCLDNNPNQRPTMAEIIGKIDAILLLQERLDSSITEGKFIDKFQWLFGAKVESKASNSMASRPLGSEGEPSEKSGWSGTDSEGEPNEKESDKVVETSDSEGESSKESGWSGTDRNLKPFSYNVLQKATWNFRPNSIPGKGNLGSVFKGWFDEQSLEATKPGRGVIFAVKRLNQQSDQDDKEWLAGISHLGKLNHPNLVKLIGYCLENDRRLLVYEFMNRGSLADHLFRRGKPLSWNLRMKIALGAARGLAYIFRRNQNAANGFDYILNPNQESIMIRCHITSSSILLDSDYNAKLSNLLLEPEYNTPERFLDALHGIGRGDLIINNTERQEMEIYDLGVVLLEVFSGKRNIDYNRRERIKVGSKPYLTREQEIMRLIDDRIDGQYTTSVAIRFARIIESCFSIQHWRRPTASGVVRALQELSPRVPKVTSATTSTSANVQKS